MLSGPASRCNRLAFPSDLGSTLSNPQLVKRLKNLQLRKIQLEAELATVDTEVKEVERELLRRMASPAEPEAENSDTGQTRRGGATAEVADVIKELGGNAKPSDIAERLGITIAAAHQRLRRGVNQGVFERSSYGTYRNVEETG